MIAYALFSHPSMELDVGELGAFGSILNIMFSSKESLIDDISVVLKASFHSWKDQVKKRLEEGIDCFSDKPKDMRPVSRWGDPKEVNDEDVINISYGGGLHYLLSFLQGREKGYKLEDSGNGLGIQVSPVKHKESSKVNEIENPYIRYSSIDYSLRHGRKFFDTPVLMRAKINARFLRAVNNNYEAGLPADSVPHLSDVKIEEIFTSSPCTKALFQPVFDNILLTLDRDHSGLFERIRGLVEKFISSRDINEYGDKPQRLTHTTNKIF